MSMIGKKIGAVLAAVVLASVPLVGCGANSDTGSAVISQVEAVVRDATTPDGALMTKLDALVAGDISTMDIGSADVIKQLEGSGISEAQMEELATVFYGQNKYEVDNVTTVSDTQAQITVSGQVLNLSEFMPDVMNDYVTTLTEYVSNNPDAQNMTQEELTKRMLDMLVDAAKEKRTSAQLKQVRETVLMEQKDGVWEVSSTDENTTKAVIQLTMGSTQEELEQKLTSLYGSLS